MSVEVGLPPSGSHLAHDPARITMNAFSNYMGATCALTPRKMTEHAALLKTQISRSREPSPCPAPSSPCSDCRRRSSGSNSPLLTARFQGRSVVSSQFLQSEKTITVTSVSEKLKRLTVAPPSSRQTGISGPDLAKLMKTKEDLLIIDCRPFISYNMVHMTGAHSLNCCDKMTKKRLSSGRIHLVDLISGEVGKADYKNRIQSANVVVYDEDSSQLDQSGKPGQPSSISLVVTTLLKEVKTVYFLKGGLSAFQKDFEEWCTKPDYKPPPKLLYSPTTPAVVDDQIDTAVISQVLPFLYIGNERDVANLALLKEHGITHVLNVTSHIPNHFEAEGLVYKRLPASDSGQQNLKQYFRQAYHFIDEVATKGGKVLVHCQAGVSRSATITISYIMRHMTLPMMDAFRFVKSKRSIVSPNFNFMGQLYELEQQLGGGKTPNLLTPPVPFEVQMHCGNV